SVLALFFATYVLCLAAEQHSVDAVTPSTTTMTTRTTDIETQEAAGATGLAATIVRGQRRNPVVRVAPPTISQEVGRTTSAIHEHRRGGSRDDDRPHRDYDRSREGGSMRGDRQGYRRHRSRSRSVKRSRSASHHSEDVEMDEKLVDALESSMEAMDANSDAAIQKRREERRKLQRQLTEREMAKK
ncbi:hypothetical protein FOZ63_018243, partial [Perkinsus olseni]